MDAPRDAMSAQSQFRPLLGNNVINHAGLRVKRTVFCATLNGLPEMERELQAPFRHQLSSAKPLSDRRSQ